jgi:hypothetical protein
MLEHCWGYLLQSVFQFIPKVFDGVEVGTLCRKSCPSTSISTNHFCMDLTLCKGALLRWNRKGPSPNCCHKVGSIELPRMSLYAVALRFPFTGTKGHSRIMKNIPIPLFLFHQTLLLVFCIGKGSVLLASAKPRFVYRTARWWSVIHHSRECVSTAPDSNGVELYTIPAYAWHCTCCS